jgi:hypothetical protein
MTCKTGIGTTVSNERFRWLDRYYRLTSISALWIDNFPSPRRLEAIPKKGYNHILVSLLEWTKQDSRVREQPKRKLTKRQSSLDSLQTQEIPNRP